MNFSTLSKIANTTTNTPTKATQAHGLGDFISMIEGKIPHVPSLSMSTATSFSAPLEDWIIARDLTTSISTASFNFEPITPAKTLVHTSTILETAAPTTVVRTLTSAPTPTPTQPNLESLSSTIAQLEARNEWLNNERMHLIIVISILASLLGMGVGWHIHKWCFSGKKKVLKTGLKVGRGWYGNSKEQGTEMV